MHVYITSNQSPTTAIMKSANKWESGTSGFDFVKTTTKSEREMYANSKPFGITGWSGYLHDVDDSGAPQCMSGRWNKNTVIASINSTYNSSDKSKRNGVAVHEFGHYLGLAHENWTASCPGGGVDYLAIMYPSDSRFIGNCSVFSPMPDDKTGVNTLY